MRLHSNKVQPQSAGARRGPQGQRDCGGRSSGEQTSCCGARAGSCEALGSLKAAEGVCGVVWERLEATAQPASLRAASTAASEPAREASRQLW
mmetsp:Transcript_112247/g.348405  ORF Transcript_112247/g.348405 Transcript_112247/m.348405 type:complete len:93 (-) Transcript_112247:370-648(-)